MADLPAREAMEFDVVIVGAGPAGLAAAIRLKQISSDINVVVVEMSGATEELAHDIAVHIAFARPKYLVREEVPAEAVAAERATLETAMRNEGKPEAAIGKIVEGKLNGFYKDLCLLEQPYAKDDKKSVAQVIGNASIVRFVQVEIG